MLTLTADISRLLRRSRAISRRYPDVARRAANSAAFYLRERTPELLEQQLDRPTRRTAKPSSFRVDHARGRDLGAVLRAIPAINGFLRKLQFGMPDEFTTRPVAPEAFDRFGNIVKKAHLRPSSKAALLAQTIQGPRGRVGRYFFGDLGRAGSAMTGTGASGCSRSSSATGGTVSHSSLSMRGRRWAATASDASSGTGRAAS